MIVRRKQKLNPNSADVQLAISYGAPDIKRIMQRFMRVLIKDPKDEDTVTLWRNYGETEAGMRYYLENDPTIFGNYDEPWKSQLSEWVWRQLVKQNFYKQSGTDESIYFLTEKSLGLADGKPYD